MVHTIFCSGGSQSPIFSDGMKINPVVAPGGKRKKKGNRKVKKTCTHIR